MKPTVYNAYPYILRSLGWGLSFALLGCGAGDNHSGLGGGIDVGISNNPSTNNTSPESNTSTSPESNTSTSPESNNSTGPESNTSNTSTSSSTDNTSSSTSKTSTDSKTSSSSTSTSTDSKTSSTSGPTVNLPHTGILNTQCYQVASNTLIACDRTEAVGLSGTNKQDGMTSGTRTMSYSRVPDPTGGYYPITSCVVDNVTGLVWEGKESGGIRGGLNTYYFLEDAFFDVYFVWELFVYFYWSEYAQDMALNYVQVVNDMALCGYTDWRMPSIAELESLTDVSVRETGPLINPIWFPNACNIYHWSSTMVPNNVVYSWGVIFHDGEVNAAPRDDRYCLRLVRGEWRKPKCALCGN